jgi:hypothetical protein
VRRVVDDLDAMGPAVRMQRRLHAHWLPVVTRHPNGVACRPLVVGHGISLGPALTASPDTPSAA